MKPVNANAFLFFADFRAELHKALRDNVTVTRFASAIGADDAGFVFEVRVVRMAKLDMPATRSPMSKDKFNELLLRANARRLLAENQRVRPGRKAARDDGQRKGSKQS